MRVARDPIRRCLTLSQRLKDKPILRHGTRRAYHQNQSQYQSLHSISINTSSSYRSQHIENNRYKLQPAAFIAPHVRIP
jgi:hypothetical protein